MTEPMPRERVVRVEVDPVNEQVVIAAALVDEAARKGLLRRLTPDHFQITQHRAIWAALQEMDRRRLSYDPATIHRLAGDKFELEYLANLMEGRPEAPPNLQWHVDTLNWDRARANAVTGPLTSLLDAVKDPRSAPERVKALARSVSEAFAEHVGASQLLAPDELVRQQMIEIDKRISGHACYPFGLEGLDNYEDGTARLLPGAAPGQVTVITAVPGAGKSTLAIRLALGLARQQRRVLIGAWEMSGGITIEIAACLSLGWSRRALMLGQITPEQRVQLEDRMHVLSRWIRIMRNPFRRRGESKPSNARNLDLVQESISDSGCEVFIADLWKRCLVDASPDAEEEALMRQQAMIDEQQVHGILLQQQRAKEVEGRPDKRPTREGIKGSGAWFEIADNIFAPHRPALFKRIPDDKFEVIILKQRYGTWPLCVEFDWDPERGLIHGGRSVEYERPGETGEEFGLPFASTRLASAKGAHA